MSDMLQSCTCHAARSIDGRTQEESASMAARGPKAPTNCVCVCECLWGVGVCC